MDSRYLASEFVTASQQERKIFSALLAAHKAVPLHQQIHHNNHTLHQQKQHDDHHQIHHNNQTPFGMMMQASSSSSPLPGSFNINKDGGAYKSGELDQDLFYYRDVQHRPIQQQRITQFP